MNETDQTPQTIVTSPSQVIIPPYHPREEERIARLYGYKILDTDPDPLLDELTKMAAIVFKAPIALISLIDKDRQWFKSTYGLNDRETCRNVGFCPYAIINDKEPFIIRDAREDARFQENPLVAGKPYIRFYAGIALPHEGGLPLGTFCVIDTKPRDITAEEIVLLQSFARIAMECIELANSRREMLRLLHLEKEVYNRLLLTSAELSHRATNFNDSLYLMVSNLDPDLGWLSARIRNMQTGGTTGIFYNPIIPPDSKLKDVWGLIDSTTSNSLTGIAHTEFISLNQQQPEYAYIVVPVRNRTQLVAVIEFLYPDHRKIDSRIKDVFDLMAVNLSIIAERELMTLTLTQQARMDPLTGSANRTVILEEIEKSLRSIDPINGKTALFYFDLNKFKEINDTQGHLIGDALLKEITTRLRILCRDGDLIGRLSGDEIIMIARGLNTQVDLPKLTQRLEECFTTSFLVQGQHILISCSIGCLIFDNPYLQVADVLRLSEEAMYRVKRGKNNGVCIVTPDILTEIEEERKRGFIVRRAIAQSGLFLSFQPIIDLASGGLCGAEALMRLKQDSGEIWTAGKFIKTLEKLSLMPTVDKWVIDSFVSQLSNRWQSLVNAGLSIWVNLTPSTLNSPGFAARTLDKLEKAGIPPSLFGIELLESDLSPVGISPFFDNLTILRDNGVKIAIDDFGTGYSNLRYLATLPIDCVKVAKPLIDLAGQKSDRADSLLKAVVSTAKNLGFIIVAEGVEDTEKSAFLKSIGFDRAQGYLYGKESSLDELTHRISTR